MTTKKLAALAIGAAALLALSLTVTSTISQAQSDGQGGVAGPGQGVTPSRPDDPFQRGGPPGGGFTEPGLQRLGGLGLGGGAAMVADNNFLYVLQGNRMFKVQKSDLRVVGQTMLMGPEMIRPPGGPGAGGPIPPKGETSAP